MRRLVEFRCARSLGVLGLVTALGLPLGSCGGKADDAPPDATPDPTACVSCPDACPLQIPLEHSACSTVVTCQYGACPNIPVVASCTGSHWELEWLECATGACPVHPANQPCQNEGEECKYVNPCCGGLTTWICHENGFWKGSFTDCELPDPNFETFSSEGEPCPYCVDPNASHILGCWATQMHVVQCRNGRWFEYEVPDNPC